MSVPPYNDLYHCTGHTYGTWLPGSRKGFRTRHHREHVEGDYRNPPPAGMYEELYRRSKELMTRDPVYLTPEQRRLALDAFVGSLLRREIDVTIASVDAVHFHVLAAFPDHNPRHWIGVAKKESSHALKTMGAGYPGGLWAVRCQCLPLTGPDHETNTTIYIEAHEANGAAISCRRDRSS